jgi:hypothetical protein
MYNAMMFVMVVKNVTPSRKTIEISVLLLEVEPRSNWMPEHRQSASKSGDQCKDTAVRCCWTSFPHYLARFPFLKSFYTKEPIIDL